MFTLPSKTLKLRLALSLLLWLAGLGSSWSADIRGHVLSSGSSVGHALSIQLSKQNPDTLIYDYLADTNSNPTTGAYQFNGLADGFYHVHVLDLTGEYAAEIYEDVYREADATIIEIQDGVALIDPVDIDVQPGATISGRAIGPNGMPIPDLAVGIAEMTDLQTMELFGGVGGINTDGNGDFKLGLRPGVYTVAIWDSSDEPVWATQLFSNTVAHEWATPIVLSTVGQVVANVNAVMQPGYDVSGKITDTNGVPLPGVFASFEVYDAARMQWGTTVSKRTGPQGTYAIAFPPGEYRVYFEENSRLYEREYWLNAEEPALANPINVVSANVSNINAQLAHTPLARWAFSYGLDPFSNVEGWLKDDPDADTYDNFHEFAFGTDPTNASSGNPIQINPPRRLPVGISPLASNTVTFSALFHQNLSTAYWLQYELQYKTNLMTPGWASEYLGIPHVLPSDPVSYIELSTNVPTTPDPNKFYRLRATLNTY